MSRSHYTQSMIMKVGLLTVMLVSMTRFILEYRTVTMPDLIFVQEQAQSNRTTINTYNINETETENNNFNTSNPSRVNFDQILWPKLKERVCPHAVPKTSLGSSIFQLGRSELGLTANPTSEHIVFQKLRRRTVNFFYNGDFGYTLFLDGVDHTNTLLYASIWKCANNQIHAYLQRIFNRKANGKIRDNSTSSNYASDTYLERLVGADIKSMFHEDLPNSKGKIVWNRTTTDSSFTFKNAVYSKPCIFTVVRDPISHFLSGYNEVEFRLIEKMDDAPQLPNQSHLVAKYTTIPYDKGPSKREERFETFVRDLLNGHPSFAYFEYYKHFASMSRIIPEMAEAKIFPAMTETNNTSSPMWFLPTVENLTETFPAFLAARCPTLARNYQRRQEQQRIRSNSTSTERSSNTTSNHQKEAILPRMKRAGGHKSSNDPYGLYNAAKNVWEKGGPTARAMCTVHIMDYACFDLEVPLLCQDVYSSERFVNTILYAK